MAGGSAAGTSGLIASYTTGLWGAYALQQLLSSATLSIKVRRSSDNTEQDIGFSGTALDTASLATFVGANDGFVSKFYDQSGSSHDLVQATTAAQPKIVDAGTYMGEVCFDGVDDTLATAGSTTATPAYSVYMAGRDRIGAAGASAVWYAMDVSGFVENRDTTVTDNYKTLISFDATSANVFDDVPSKDGTVYCGFMDRSKATIALGAIFYKDGVAQTSIATTGSMVSGNFATGVVRLGSGSAANFSRLACRSYLVYQASHNSTTVGQISTVLSPSAVATVNGLDSYTTSLWGVFSLRKQLTAYAGSSIRVRRSSDSTEQDIGFVSDLLDTASLLTFTGAGDGFVKTFYDQSGSSHDFTQATTTKQPKIVSSGVVLRGITPDGTDDILITGNSSAINKFTSFFKGNIETTATCSMLEQSTTYNGNSGQVLYFATTSMHVGTGGALAANYATRKFDTSAVGQVLCAAHDRSAASSTLISRLFSGGRLLTSSADESAGSLPTGNSATQPWHLFARSGSAIPMAGDAETIVIYEAALTDANIERISRVLG